jgi:outer membrane protein OmpA-like peptidoglycan-associated protein
VLTSTAQNLVPNPGFELIEKCPSTYSDQHVYEFAPDWFSPDFRTPDIYHECSTGKVGVPENWAGIAPAKEGKAYAGIYIYRKGGYREHLMSKLTQPLIKDSVYEIGFYLLHAIYSSDKFQKINIALLNEKPVFDFKGNAQSEINSSELPIKNSSNESFSRDWIHVSTTYRAKGGERFFLIGWFDRNPGDNLIDWPYFDAIKNEAQLKYASYYYIDSVYVMGNWVTPQVEQQESPPAKEPEEKIFVMEDVLFPFDEATLLEPAMAYLDSIMPYLEFADSVIVEGHTDEKGTDEYNYELALRRAENVADYLTRKGLGLPIYPVSYGESRPIADDRRNRRVVIRKK